MDIEVSMMLGAPLQHALQIALESENLRRVKVGKDLKDPLVPSPLSIARDIFRIPLNLALNTSR